jgi:hypothetical protein
MKNLRRVGAAVALTFVLSLSTLAGEVETPPCAPPIPGEVETPPCAKQMPLDNSAIRGETLSFASNTGSEFSATAAAIDILQSVLSLF